MAATSNASSSSFSAPQAFPAPQGQRACARCRRLRRALAGLLLAVACLGLCAAAADGIAPAASPSAPLPAQASASAPPGAVAAPAAASALSRAAQPAVGASASASAAGELRLVYRTVVLPAGRRDVPYGPSSLVSGGVPPYHLEVEGVLPPGLALDAAGVLAGTPTRPGRYPFTLSVEDAAVPPRLTRQPYTLQIGRAPGPARAASAPPAAPAALHALSADETAALADGHRGVPATWQLTADDLAALVPEVADAAPVGELPLDATVPPPETATAAGPTTEQQLAVLTPLLDVEYPTRALFERALDHSRCAYYQAHVAEMALKRGRPVDATCPPRAPTPGASASARRAGEVPLAQFHADLLPPQRRAEVVALAQKVHPMEDAAPLAWTGEGCGCNQPRGNDQVYGFFPYWLGGGAAQAVDFSLFTRIGMMGAVIGDDANLTVPGSWDHGDGRFAREAQRHGTALDLVVYRRDWDALLARPDAQLDTFARTAARNAVAAADLRLDEERDHLAGRLLLPFWRSSRQMYGGITVFFEDSPTEARAQRRFKRFYRAFALALIAEMQSKLRPYRLNFVVPDHRLGDEDGPYGFDDLMEYLETAERAPRQGPTDEAVLQRYHGTTDIEVFYLVLLGEPTSRMKEVLRAKVGETTVLRGHRRVAFLESMVPLQFHARGKAPVPLAPLRRQQLDDDMAYMLWNFGGAAFWPVPVAGQGTGGAVRDVLAENYAPPPSSVRPLCDLVCPNRYPLRLVMQLLLVAVPASLALYAWNCRVRHAAGRRMVLLLWAGVLLTLAVLLVLFSCDPGMLTWRQGNYPFYALIVLLVLGAAYVTFKPRVDAP